MPRTLTITLPDKPFDCQACKGHGSIECRNQKCTHWCECTVCGGYGKVVIVDLKTLEGGYVTKEVSLPANLEADCDRVPHETRAERIKGLVDELNEDVPPECVEAVKLEKPVLKVKSRRRA